MNTATLVRHLPVSGGGADQRLYRLNPPIITTRWNLETDEEYETEVPIVITSAVDVYFSGPETYLFAANEAGEITDWAELPGSFKGSLDHEAALRRAGYEVQS